MGIKNFNASTGLSTGSIKNIGMNIGIFSAKYTNSYIIFSLKRWHTKNLWDLQGLVLGETKNISKSLSQNGLMNTSLLLKP